MAAKYLTIPEAIDLKTGRYIKAHEADPKAEKGRYICRDTNCKKAVRQVVRNNSCFFRHYPEGVKLGHKKSHELHSRAINEIKNQFENFKKNGLSMPIFLLDTSKGKKEVVPFLGGFLVKTEWQLGDRKIDVAITDNFNQPILLIEVLNKSKVTKEKSIDIVDFPWIEIKATSILENQRILKVERHHRFPQEFDDTFQMPMAF